MSEIEKYKRKSQWINILTVIALLLIMFSIYWFVDNQEELVTEVETVQENVDNLVLENNKLETTNLDLNRTVESLKFQKDTLSQIVSALTTPVPEIIINRRTGYNEVRKVVSDYIRFWNSRQQDSLLGLMSNDIERFYGLSKRNEISKEKVSQDISKRWKDQPKSEYKLLEKSPITIVLLDDNNFLVSLKGLWVDTEAEVASTVKINDSMQLFYVRHRQLN